MEVKIVPFTSRIEINGFTVGEINKLLDDCYWVCWGPWGATKSGPYPSLEEAEQFVKENSVRIYYGEEIPHNDIS